MNITHSPVLVPPTGDDLSSSTTAASGVVTSSSYPSQQQQQQQKQHKSPLSSSSVALGVTAAACEWIVALIIIAFVASFIVEFGRIRKVHSCFTYSIIFD